MSAVLIDLLIAAIVVLNIYLGWKKGMVRSLLAVAATIIALIAASQIADVATDLMIDKMIRPAAQSAIEEYMRDMDQNIVVVSPVQELRSMIDTIENELVREQAHNLLVSMEMSEEPIVITTKDDLSNAGNQIVDAVLTGPVRHIISAVISLLCFILLSLAFRPVIWLVNQAFRLPLLRQVNQVGGILSGAVKGVLLVLIAVWALRTAQFVITDEIVQQSFLLKIAADFLDSLGFGNVSIQ